MKLKAIAAITAALTISGMGIAQAADPIKVYANKTKGTNVADNTLDGDFSSRWIAKGDGSFIQYQFEEAVTLEAIKIAFFKGDSRTASFRIESTDAPWKASAVWEQQALMESSGTSTDLETFELAEPVTAKYFRIVGHGFVGKWGWESNINGITEAEFVDSVGKEEPVVAEICGQSASTEDGENVAANVVDGDLATRWSGNSDVANATLTLELCEEATLSGVSAAFHKGDTRSHDFSIEVSNDNSTWTPALPQTTTANDTLETQNFAFEEEVSATYIRYTGYGNSGGSSWNSVTELTVCQGDECGVYVAPPFCELYPEHVSCLDFCELYPEDESCLSFCELNPDDSACNVNVTPLTCEEMYSCWSDENTGSVSVSGSMTTNVDGLEDAITSMGMAGGYEIILTGSGEISLSDLNFAAPILIRAQTIGGTELETANIKNSNNIALQGFSFPADNEPSNRVKIVNSTNIKVLRNIFDHSGVTTSQTTITTTQASQYIEIAYNTFKDKDVSDAGSFSKITGSYIKTQLDEDEATGALLMTKNLHVHHNNFSNIKHYMQDADTVAGDSDREVIAMGIADSQDEITNNVVEYNLFDNCDGENEIITVKTSNNVFRYNTFKNSMGSLSFRLGNNNIALGNYFYGEGASANPDDANYETGGVRTYSDGHIIRDNYMEGLTGLTWRLPILVDNGDNSDTLGGDSHQNSTNVIVQNNTLVNNLGGLQIGGYKYGNKPENISIFDNLVVGKSGELLTEVTEANNIWSGNQGYAYDGATVGMGEELSSMPATPSAYPKLTESDVGHNAAN